MASMSLSSLGLMTARADVKSDRRARDYKIGAAVLGGAALYYGLKKKNPVGAIVAGAGAYYAYKKGQQESDKSRRDRYGYNPDGSTAGNVYPDDNGGYANGGYANADDANGGYSNGYPVVSPQGGYQGGYDDGAGYPPSTPRGRYNDGTGNVSYPRHADGDGDDYGATVDNGTYNNGAYNNGAYNNGGYAQNNKYPVYGLDSQRVRRDNGSSSAPHHHRHVTER